MGDRYEQDEQGKARRYEQGNARAAAIILADPERYDGLPLMWAKLWSSRHPGQLIEIPEEERGSILGRDVEERAGEIAGGGVTRAPTGRRNKRQSGLFDNLPIGRGIEDLEGSVAVAAEMSIAELFWKDPPFVDKRQMTMFDDVAVVEPEPIRVVVKQEPVSLVPGSQNESPDISSGPYVATDDDIPF